MIDKTNKSKEEVLDFLLANKTAIMKMKRESVKYADNIDLHILEKNKTQFKAAAQPPLEDGQILKTIVANAYNWMDSHDDVHINGCFKKSIKENKNVFHLHDHEFKVTSQVGEIQALYEQSVPLKSLGLNMDGETQCLLMDTIIEEDLNEVVYNLYSEGEINQHSVGMRYVQLFMCVNSEAPGWEQEKKNWNKYIDSVINRDKAEGYGYFFAVTEAKLIEVSCVLLGSNELTPTLDDCEDDSEDKSTLNEPVKPLDEKPLDAKAILAKTFIDYYLN